jgi:hypothetical protein
VALNDWKATRHAPPERRVLMGDCLLVRYVEADQGPGAAEQNRENERRRGKREEYAAAFKAANPDKPLRLNKEQSAECKWAPEGLRLRLRVECQGVDCDLHEALLMSTLRDGDRLVLFPRWTVDERLPAAERTEFTPTPKQMLYPSHPLAPRRGFGRRIPSRTGVPRRGSVRRPPPKRSSVCVRPTIPPAKWRSDGESAQLSSGSGCNDVITRLAVMAATPAATAGSARTTHTHLPSGRWPRSRSSR